MIQSLLCFIFIVFSQQTLAKDIFLSIGESHSVASHPLQTVRVQKKGILSIKDLGNQLIFTGKKLGFTTVTLGKNTLSFYVLHKAKHTSFRALQEWLKNKRGPVLELKNSTPQLEGKLLRFKDFEDLANFHDQNAEFTNAMDADPEVKPQIEKWMNEQMKEYNLASGRLQIEQGPWSLFIPQSAKDQLSFYRKIVNPFGITVSVDPQSLTHKPVVEIKVYIAHVKKTFLRRWGMEWPSQWTANLIPGAGVQFSQLQLSLNTLEEEGWGQMLASPTLISESDETASFHSGGEFPVRTTTQFNNNVQWKQYGLFLNTKSQVNSRGHLRVEVDLQVSSLDTSNGNEGVPALVRNQVKTVINMKQAQPFLLSGFLHQMKSTNNSGLPWLQQIPIFSSLFSTGEIHNSNLELVFFMIPKVRVP